LAEQRWSRVVGNLDRIARSEQLDNVGVHIRDAASAFCH
jgi:hypothetical protein